MSEIEAVSTNFLITYPGATTVRKRLRPTAEGKTAVEMNERLSTESAALILVNHYCPGLAVERIQDRMSLEVTSGLQVEAHNYRFLEIERVDTGTRVDLKSMLETIDTLQDKIPVPDDDTESPLLSYDTSDYLSATEDRLVFLRLQRGRMGFTETKAKHIEQRMDHTSKAIKSFARVFVHTDVQRRHFGRSQSEDGQLGVIKIFDFDQAHFGNELEDYVFLAMRHPQWREQVLNHLRQRFEDDPVKLGNLDQAFAFFTDYFLVKGIYDRVHQDRGTIFDSLAKIYGRLALNSPRFRQASAFVLSKLAA